MSWSAGLASTTRLVTSALAIGLAAATVGTAQRAVMQPQFIAPSTVTELRARDQQVQRMLRDGDLRLRQVREDMLMSGVTHERGDQYYRGVRVFGGDVARQLHRGQLRSVYGVVYQGIDIDTTPQIDEEAARALVRERTGARLAPGRGPELVVLPLDEGGYELAWSARVRIQDDVRQMFFDADDGRLLLDYSDLQTQQPRGTSVRGTGVLGDAKKISVFPDGPRFVASDRLRPPSLITYDMKGDHQRTEDFLDGFIQLGQGDIATDTKATWSDGAIVDAHAYTGFTYDYYFKRFGRRGLDNNNKGIQSLVHPVRRNEVFDLFSTLSVFFSNAAYFGDGVMVYGVGLPPGVTVGGRSWDYTSGALDIVAHELTHGVTDYSSNLVYRNESGALNEAFSDIMATGVEFFFQEAGVGNQRADYLCAEDVVKASGVTGIRSLENPRLFGHPDHYSIRFQGTSDNGGVHINSGIANHAFYLAVEGGTNRTSGLSVQGVGGGNREQIEKVFYRAFTQMLPSNATFSVARAATIQAARDLYSGNSAVERAVTQAWDAVGVQ